MFSEIVKIVFAVIGGGFLVYIGLRVLRFVAQKPPAPPPPGSMRKVKLNYLCSICFSEVQMKVAPMEDPEPPRHCGDEMDLQAPIDE